MKLLLTSGGIENSSMEKSLRELVGKDFSEATVAFIPTAANVEEGDKWWLINDLTKCKDLGFKEVDVVDISAVPESIWQPRLEHADVLIFGGGNSSHLMYWIVKSGLKSKLNSLLRTRVYVGISAGSIVTNPTLFFSSKDKKIYYEEAFGYNSKEALSLVDFYVRPHLNSPYFSHARAEVIQKAAREVDLPVYALDDNSAVQVVDGKAQVVSEGEWKVYNEDK